MLFRKKIPQEDQELFDMLQKCGVCLDRSIPLMPAFHTGGWRRTIKLMSKIKTLPTGTRLVFHEIKMNGPRAWYRVSVKDSLVSGWINSVVLEARA